MSEPKTLYSTGQAAKVVGIRPDQVMRLYERGLMPPAQRVGIHRAIPVDDLPRLKEAAIEAGYLKP